MSVTATRARPAHRSRIFTLALIASAALLLTSIALSIGVGARSIPLPVILEALTHPDRDIAEHTIVLVQRIPRTIVGLLAGAALALAGTLMQGLTRNPFADPGLLGVNAGASTAVIGAISLLGITQPSGYVWFAFAGAAAASLLVALIGSAGPDGSNPARLALTGAAVTAGLTAVTWFVLMTERAAMDAYRYWSVGALTARGLDTVVFVAIPLVIGVVLAFASTRGLDLIALGEDTARGLGHDVNRTRVFGIIATVLLAGGATAIAGPIVFLGLMIPHLLRSVVGESYPRLATLGVFVGASLLLLSDVAGRVIALPGEVQAGVVVAFIGAPLLIVLVLRPKPVTL